MTRSLADSSSQRVCYVLAPMRELRIMLIVCALLTGFAVRASAEESFGTKLKKIFAPTPTPTPRKHPKKKSTAEQSSTPKPTATPEKSPSPKKKGAPATISASEIADYAKYPEHIRNVIDMALQLTTRNLDYKYGSADPASGGMDCSGFVFYVLTENGVRDVPRDSSQQY